LWKGIYHYIRIQMKMKNPISYCISYGIYYSYFTAKVIYVLYFRLFNFLYTKIFNIKKEEIITIKKRDELFAELQVEKFEKILENKDVDFNSNIDKLFYDKTEYDTTMKQENNLEKIWKTRMLMTTTPRGNVVMYYDPYKMGFAYYSDENVMPYNVLNNCAMKYVERFRCLHFFLDEHIMKSNINPLIDIHFKTPEKKNDVEKKEKKHFSSSNPVFAKLKKMEERHKPAESLKEAQEKESTEKALQEKALQEKIMNKFIYLGKTQNLKLLQSTPKMKTLGTFKSPLLEKMKFSDFKKLAKGQYTG